MTEGTDPAASDPIAAWAASGAMALTGHADGPPLSPAAAVVPALATLAHRFTHLAATLASSPTEPRPPAARGTRQPPTPTHSLRPAPDRQDIDPPITRPGHDKATADRSPTETHSARPDGRRPDANGGPAEARPPGAQDAGEASADARSGGDETTAGQWPIETRQRDDETTAGQWPIETRQGGDETTAGRWYVGTELSAQLDGSRSGGHDGGVAADGRPVRLGEPATSAAGRGAGGPHAAARRGGGGGTGGAGFVGVDVGQLLGGRAGLLGLGRQGQVSANGSCRLLPTADGWAAVNLARRSDVEAVGALVERVVDGDPWTVLARSAERLAGADLIERATLLGIPAAVVPPAPPTPAAHATGRPRHWGPSHRPAPAQPTPEVPHDPTKTPHLAPAPPSPPTTDGPYGVSAPTAAGSPGTAVGTVAGGGGRWSGTAESGVGPAPFTLRRLGAVRPDGVGTGARAWTVVDLSAMWAGPLCARLLGLAGLRVVKVESTRRPDGARAGDARFFDWLHGGHASVALDLATPGGRAALVQLVAAADVVIESSRPRALAQLGVDAEAVVGARPGVTWVSITGYGRDGAAGQRVAFGDDAAAAAGLVAHDDQGRPVFCGDAIADPITGLSAAVGALTSILAGGGHLVDVPMRDAVAAAMAVPAAPATARLSPDGIWQVATTTGVHPVAAPHALAPAVARAARLGADTAAVLRPLGIAPC